MIGETAPATCQEENDFAVIQAAQQGDRHALGQLFQSHQKMVYATVYRRLENHAESQDLCQEVFLKAMTKIGQLKDPRRFSGWLRTLATMTAINAVRRPRRELGWSREFEDNRQQQMTPEEIIMAEEQRTQVRHAVRRLSQLDQESLSAFYFDGQSLGEMSDHLGTPVNTFKRRLHTARKRLAQELAALAPGKGT
ncbi:MAG: RNA polymerase sigma factor [Planctomycetota bacterium]